VALAIDVNVEPASIATTGLTNSEVAERRLRDGPNEVPRSARTSAIRQLLAQWTHFFAILLWVASALAIVAGMPQLGAAIAVVINGLFAFVQEHRAEKAADGLQDLLPKQVTVRRDGELGIVDAVDLVRGDVALLAGSPLQGGARWRSPVGRWRRLSTPTLSPPRSSVNSSSSPSWPSRILLDRTPPQRLPIAVARGSESP